MLHIYILIHLYEIRDTMYSSSLHFLHPPPHHGPVLIFEIAESASVFNEWAIPHFEWILCTGGGRPWYVCVEGGCHPFMVNFTFSVGVD